MIIQFSSLECPSSSLKQIDLYALSYSSFITKTSPSAMVRDQLFWSKDKAANKSIMSSDKEHDEEWLEGLSPDVAIPESPFIDAKNLCLELYQGIQNLQDKMINGRNDSHVFALFSHSLYHFWCSRGLKGHIRASRKFEFWNVLIKSQKLQHGYDGTAVFTFSNKTLIFKKAPWSADVSL